MKRILLPLLLSACLLAGCGARQASSGETAQTAGTVQIANPWTAYETLADAESAAGLALGVPETVEPYRAESFRVMNGQLLEVIYRGGESEVTVRVVSGEGQDISGVYNTYETVTETERSGGSVTEKTDGTEVLLLVSHGGRSWSLFAPSGFADDAAEAFLSSIFQE